MKHENHKKKKIVTKIGIVGRMAGIIKNVFPFLMLGPEDSQDLCSC